MKKKTTVNDHKINSCDQLLFRRRAVWKHNTIGRRWISYQYFFNKSLMKNESRWLIELSKQTEQPNKWIKVRSLNQRLIHNEGVRKSARELNSVHVVFMCHLWIFLRSFLFPLTHFSGVSFRMDLCEILN